MPTTITKAEAVIFGIPYPLTAGWLGRHGSQEITHGMRNRLVQSLRTKNSPMVNAGLAVLGEPPSNHAKVAESRKARRKERKAAKRHELGKSLPAKATRYYQPPPPDHRLSKVDPNGPEFLLSFEWRALRMKVLAHYGATCMCCGATKENGVVINVDHIKSRKKRPDLALSFDNLQVLCDVCNHGKSNWDETDWRPEETPTSIGVWQFKQLMRS